MTKTDLFRRRIAPILFGVAIALMARKSCHQDERAHATFVIDLGAARADVRSLSAELWMNGELIGELHRNALDGQTIGTPRFESMLPANDGELRIDAATATASKHVVRHVHAEDDATVTVHLENELR